MSYKVLIPTAGTGSRLGGITKHLNKSLVNVGNKPVLSHIIEMFPDDAEFVIPVGYKGDLVKEFINLAYPERKIQVVDILLYEGAGSGLGLTIQKCKEFLQAPFIFCSCDTLVKEDIPEPTINWMGYDVRDDAHQYRTIQISNEGKVVSISEKGINLSFGSKPYIGLAGIKDYDKFWKYIKDGGKTAIEQGEVYGLWALLALGIKAQKFTWFDTGTLVELETTRGRYISSNGPNILPKSDEAIWFVDNKVIKFSRFSDFISDRVERSSFLNEFVPKVIGHTTHMYSYNYVQGDVLSKCVSLKLFEKFLTFSQKFWQEKELSGNEAEEFLKNCTKFYKDKTYERLDMFYKNFQRKDNVDTINGESFPPLVKILDSLDWEKIANGLPGQFHGDYHFENIVYNDKKSEFKFLDWRQNFCNDLMIGDIYYDLAKLLHGLIMSHEIIAKGDYEVEWKGNKIVYDFNRKQKFVECEYYYYSWLEHNGYDIKRVKILTALIFLNIAALHEYPYVLLLYGLGKKMLSEVTR